MRWIGEGAQLFSVRVDLVAPDDSSHWVTLVADALRARLPFSSGIDRCLAGVDQGRGIEGSRSSVSPSCFEPTTLPQRRTSLSRRHVRRAPTQAW